MSKFLLVLVGLIVALGMIGYVLRGPVPARPSRRPDPAPAVEPVATIDKSPEMQEGRKKLIGELIDKGVFSKIEKLASIPKVYTGPAWSSLLLDDRERFVGVIYAFYFDGSRRLDMVIIRDGKTGKDVAEYSLMSGYKSK